MLLEFIIRLGADGAMIASGMCKWLRVGLVSGKCQAVAIVRCGRVSADRPNGSRISSA
jgi:hypothetical protein